MEDPPLRGLIWAKINDGRLPKESFRGTWGGRGGGELCAACEEIVTNTQVVMEGIAEKLGRCLSFHIRCFHFWEIERRKLNE